ncbi:MAG: phosphoglycerate kinase [Planctomycetota bacterium]
MTLQDLDVAGKTVLMRADFNVPLDGRTITDDRRITQAMPTIKSIVSRGGRLVLMSHLGRPKGERKPEFSLKPVADYLQQHSAGTNVHFADDCIGDGVKDLVGKLGDGDVLLLENLRYHKGEEKNEADFVDALIAATSPDAYVNDAFGTAHRNHASTYGVPAKLKESGKPMTAGFLIEKELQFLGDAVSQPQRPFVAILGGAKVSDKINVIEELLTKADTLLIGGAMAYTFFLALGKQVGNSLVEKDKVDLAKSLLDKAGGVGGKIKLPVDTVISDQMTDDATTSIVEGDIPDGMEGFDIGPKTRDSYVGEIKQAKTVIWNGPMGVFEKTPFAAGTQAVADACAAATRESGAITIIGGGDSAAAVEKLGLSEHVSHVSTGGGASLEFLEKGRFDTLDLLK